MNRFEIINRLLADAEPAYKSFTEKLVPNTEYPVLGVRVPKIKALAKTLNEPEIAELQAESYEEVMLRLLAAAMLRCPIEEKLDNLSALLPLIDNWAICDSTAMAVAPKASERDTYYHFAMRLARDPEMREYFVRFGVVTLSSKFVDEAHIDEILSLLGEIQSELYYINMAVAWAVCDCFIRFPQKTRLLMQSGALSEDVLKKAKQKIRDSRRVSAEDKEKL